MLGLEVVLAVVGGAVMGVGVGLMLAHRAVRRMTQRVQRTEVRLRSTVIPLLERQAERLGVPRERRSYGATDSVQIASDLATAILQHEGRDSLQWSDTVEASLDAVSGDRPRVTRAER